MSDFFAKICNLFNPQETEVLDGYIQAEREAILDLLVLIEYSDNEIVLEEREHINNQLASMNWDSETSLEDYNKSSITKVRSALSSNSKTIELLANIKSRFANKENINKAISFAKEIAAIDGINDKEKDFLKIIESALK